jgi:hypothetical protein
MERIEQAILKTRATIEVAPWGVRLLVYDVPKSLNERDKQRWWVKMEDKAIWLGIVQKALVECQSVLAEPVNAKFMAKAHWQQCRVHPLDYDNSISGIKHLQDAMVDVGVLKADDWKHILKLEPERDIKVKHYADQMCELIYTRTDVPVIE